MQHKIALVWFRNDLRIHDNEALYSAFQKYDTVLSVYCFDPRHFHKTDLGFPKIGTFKAKFLIESVENLKENLKSLNSHLIVSLSEPEIEIPKICNEHEIFEVFCHTESGTEETYCKDQVEKKLFKENIKLTSFSGQTLYHRDDLPFSINRFPEVFTKSRKIIEKETQVRHCFPTPKAKEIPFSFRNSLVPSLFQLGLEDIEIDPRSSFPFKGGEDLGIAHLQNYIWEKELITSYKETRNGLIGTDYSSKFSPWISVGALSPRNIYHEIKKFERIRLKNKSTYWLIFELLWRDFFNFQAQKHGSKIFVIKGVNNITKSWEEDVEIFNKWIEGNTGIPFIDSNMRELKQTGFISNRGRQNVASFLIKDLNINWLWGAAYFESMLIDHDVSSNYGNWQYVAGVGFDPMENRYFNVLKQALSYDEKGEFTKLWLPELEKIDASKIHQIFNLTINEKKNLNIDYPKAIKIPDSFEKFID